MSTGRMEAFSDGVIAILITVMVLELPKPHSVTWSALDASLPVLLAYVLSFVYLGIYWNNHHHKLQATHRVSGLILWANLHLLFWLSLVPFTTSWLGENELATVPAAGDGINLLAAVLRTTRFSGRSFTTRARDRCLRRLWARTARASHPRCCT